MGVQSPEEVDDVFESNVNPEITKVRELEAGNAEHPEGCVCARRRSNDLKGLEPRETNRFVGVMENDGLTVRDGKDAEVQVAQGGRCCAPTVA